LFCGTELAERIECGFHLLYTRAVLVK